MFDRPRYRECHRGVERVSCRVSDGEDGVWTVVYVSPISSTLLGYDMWLMNGGVGVAAQFTIEAAAGKYKELENQIFVGNGRFVREEGHSGVEFRVSVVVPSTATD